MSWFDIYAMRLSVNQLRRIIREEVSKTLLEYSESRIVRRGDDLYLTDDMGNEEYHGPVKGSKYEKILKKSGDSTRADQYSGSYSGTLYNDY